MAALNPDFEAALVPVIEALGRLGVGYRLGGSVASSAFGRPRSTLDIDVVAPLEERHVAPLVTALERDYYISDTAVREAAARRSSFNVG